MITTISSQLSTDDVTTEAESARQAAKAIAKLESARNTVASLRAELRRLRAQVSQERSSVKISRLQRRITRTASRLGKARSTARARYELLVKMGLVKSR